MSYQIINGDCVKEMDRMIKYEIKVNKVITSPPYNIIRPNLKDRGYDEYSDGMSNSDYCKWTVDIFNRYDKILEENGCIMYNMSYGTENTECMNLAVASILQDTNFTLADIVVWKKNTAIPNAMSSNRMTRIVEFVYIFCRRSEAKTFTSNKKVKSLRKTGQKNYENVYNFIEAKNNDGSTKINKATFSSDLVSELMDRYVRDTDIVLDNFNGTGTTGVSCAIRGNKYYGIEMSKAQCKYSEDRIMNIIKKKEEMNG